MTDEKLQTYFKFDDADLESNRQGKLSEKQKARLAESSRSRLQARKLYGILGLGVGLGLAVIMPFLFRDVWFLWILFGLLSGLMGFYLLRTPPGKNKSYKVRKMQGPISYSRHIHRDKEVPVIGYWIIHVGKSWFNVAEDMPDIIKEGAEYAVYTYASEGSTHILSAELISETATLSAQ